MIRTISKRYAKAIVQIAEEKKTVEKTQADLAAFVGADTVSLGRVTPSSLRAPLRRHL